MFKLIQARKVKEYHPKVSKGEKGSGEHLGRKGNSSGGDKRLGKGKKQLRTGGGGGGGLLTKHKEEPQGKMKFLRLIQERGRIGVGGDRRGPGKGNRWKNRNHVGGGWGSFLKNRPKKNEKNR